MQKSICKKVQGNNKGNKNKNWATNTKIPFSEESINDSMSHNLSKHGGQLSRWIYPSIIVVTTILYSLLYINTMPVTEGWGIFYAEQLFQGKIPYRDFYYYLPPLNLAIDAIFWKLAFGYLILYRVYWLLQRVVIRVLVYELLGKLFSRTSAFFASILSIVITTANVYDLLGDYNQTQALLGVIIAFCTVGFVQAQNEKKKYKNIFWAGFVLGLMFLIKQTIFLATGIIHFVVLVAYCVCRNEPKKVKNYLLSVIGGMMIPLVIVFLYLDFNDAFIPFLEQVFFNVDGKGSLLSILFSGLINELKKIKLVSIILVFFAFYYIMLNEERKRTITTREYILIGAAELSLVCAFYHDAIMSVVSSLINVVKVSRYAVLLVVIAVVELLCAVIYNKKKRDKRVFLFLIGVYTLEILAFTSLSNTFSASLYKADLFTLIGTDMYTLFFLSGIAIAVYYIAEERKNVVNYPKFYVLCAACSMHYAGLMAGRTGAGYHAFFLLAPFVLCFIFEECLNHSNYSKVVGLSIYAVCVIACCIVISSKVWCSYVWWGTSDDPLSTKTYTSDIKALKGVRLSYNQKQFYDDIVNTINENIDSDDTIFSYPHMKIFNVLCNNYNLKTFVPVVFYDVAADAYIEKETNLLKHNLPDIVIWEEIESCKELHESVYRDGKLLKQREMEDFFYSIFDTDYKLLESIGNFTVYTRLDKSSN